MFTGIVQKLCKVISVIKEGSLLHYGVDIGESIPLGSSVAINGVCQTVVQEKNGIVFFEAIEESCRCSTLNELTTGEWVNVERAAKIGDEIGGHFVAGHISCKVLIQSIEKNVFTISLPSSYFAYLFPKCFVALHGISLTLCEVDVVNHLFTVHLIPETLNRTNLAHKKAGDFLNFEFDYLVQAVVESTRKFFI